MSMRVQARRLMLSAFVVATNALPRPLPPQTLQLPPQTLQLAAHATAIDIDVEALARKYAPTTVFSPLEKFFFADPVKYLSAATLAKPSADGKSFTDLGKVVPNYDEGPVAQHMKGPEIAIAIDIGLGGGQATVWTCDLTHAYITINGDYRS